MANIITIEVRAQGAKSLDNLKKSLISLAPAAAPASAVVAQGLAAIAAQAGAATVATAALGAAVIPQVKAMNDLASAQAAQVNSMKPIPAATRQAAQSFTQLRVAYRDWSDELAGDAMPVVSKSMQNMTAILPHLSETVRGASTEFDRLMNIIAGGVGGGAFAKMMDQFAEFSSGALNSFVDGVVRLSRVLSEGGGRGPLTEFIEYARENGPAVQETLRSLGEAVMNLISAMAEAGPSALAIVNVFADLISAIPPEFLGTLLKLYTAFKLITTAGAGIAALIGIFGGLRTAFLGVYASTATLAGTIAALRAAFLALGTAAKASVIVGGIALLAVAVEKLTSIGEKAPPNVDKLTASLGKLGQTGKVSGYAAEQFGSNFEKLGEQINKVLNPSVTDSIDNWGADITDGLLAASDSMEEFKESAKSVDESLVRLVQGGNAEEAAAGLRVLAEMLGPEKFARLREELDGYDSVLADLAFEQDQVAQSMGVFGQAAHETARGLAEQKRAADGLKASLFALTEVNRDAYDAQIAFEESLDGLAEAFAKNGANLDISTEAGRENGKAMSAAAAAQQEMILAGIAAGDTLETMVGKSSNLRTEMMRLATEAFGGNTAAAEDYVNTLLGTPESVTTYIRMEQEQAAADLENFYAVLQDKPSAKSITLETLSAAAEATLTSFGLQVERLPDGRVTVTAANGQAIGAINAVTTAMNNLDGTVATTYVHQKFIQFGNKVIAPQSAGRMASGGPIRGPGTGTSDDIPIMASNGEYVMRAAAVDKYGEKFLDLLNEGKLDLPRFAKGGKVSEAERARKELIDFTSLSYFSRNAGFKNNEFISGVVNAKSVGDIVRTMNQMASLIRKSSSGKAEERALRAIGADGSGNPLWQHQRNLQAVNKSLENAKKKLDDLRDSAAQLRESVKGKVLGEADITQTARASDTQTTINTVLRQMRGSASNSKQFASMLSQLKNKGLSGDLISQIAEAGISGGGMETAAAILGGGASGIKELNALQKDINKYATAAGKTASDAMYGAGIAAADGLVKGLQKKQDQIEATMLKIAKSMEKAIKKALGIKSPSKVMEEIGDFTAEGFARGIERNTSVRPAWDSMLNQPAPANVERPAGGGQGGLVLEIRSGGSRLDDLIVEIIRKSIRTKGGGNVQAYLGA
ncbi:hypothetical protein ACPCIZ_12920 [Streptomyces cellulosae]